MDQPGEATLTLPHPAPPIFRGKMTFILVIVQISLNKKTQENQNMGTGEKKEKKKENQNMTFIWGDRVKKC